VVENLVALDLDAMEGESGDVESGEFDGDAQKFLDERGASYIDGRGDRCEPER
jgi:hypothetical protein